MKSLTLLSVLCIAAYFYTTSTAQECPQCEYGWARTVGSITGDQARGVAVDQLGNVYAVGGFSGKVDFDPSKKKDKFKSKGKGDIFITSYTSDGKYRWTDVVRGTKFDTAFSTTVTPSGDIAISGRFQNKVDFDPTKGKDKRKAASAIRATSL